MAGHNGQSLEGLPRTMKSVPNVAEKPRGRRFSMGGVASLALLISLTAYAADINSDLIKAARKGDVRKVDELVKKGADVNAKDKGGKTALMQAAQRGKSAVVGALLENGADPNARDKDGHTALMLAILEIGPGKFSFVPFTPLLRYSTVPNSELWLSINTLLAKGADFNIKDKDGMTALMHATNKGDLAVVQALLDKGADASAKNNQGFTAADLAGAQFDIVHMLFRAEAASDSTTEVADLSGTWGGKLSVKTSVLEAFGPRDGASYSLLLRMEQTGPYVHGELRMTGGAESRQNDGKVFGIVRGNILTVIFQGYNREAAPVFHYQGLLDGLTVILQKNDIVGLKIPLFLHASRQPRLPSKMVGAPSMIEILLVRRD